jgi:TetR/AcrR family tetracycline transcriptional repressor
MKINRDMVTRAGLKLLDGIGLQQLTLRRLAEELDVQAATIYWHFKSKEDLIDEMATTVLAEGAASLTPRRKSSDWQTWASTFGEGLRKTLLQHRDGARMVAGTRLTNDDFLKTTDRIGSRMLEAGFSVRAAVVLGTTIYNYTLNFVMEEQAVFPTPGERSPAYNLDARKARLTAAEFPFHSQTTAILFDRFDRRYKQGLALIIAGAQPNRKPRAKN